MLKGQKGSRSCERKEQVNNNEYLTFVFNKCNYHLPSTNVTGSEQTHGFTMNSLKVSVKAETRAVAHVLSECFDESEFFLKMPQRVKRS